MSKRQTMSTPEIPALAPADYRLSVVLPVYSETDTVRQIVDWLRRELGELLTEIIIVVSPRSHETCRAVCEELAGVDTRIRLHTQENNPGLGYAVREGLQTGDAQ